VTNGNYSGTLLAFTGRANNSTNSRSIRHRKTNRRYKQPSRKRKRISNTHTRKKRGRSGRYTPRTAGKRKDTSHKRIRYTKNGQPYVIMGNGKARFISRRGAKQSHRRAGGRY
jgi:hypothetical protein